ncbi:MAG: coproporphyrinogen III oxidase, partial [Alphaproteobacteria bacterium]|nr:coproporphyrinogen III oxidase [Alphaproteobacteria bacterium]
RGIVIPDDDHAVALYERTQAMTNAAGRPAYEISNHASPGAECRHNLIYWRYGDYAGAGPGAHGRLQIGGKRLATLCERLPERWQDQVRQEGHGIVEVTEISAAEAAREHLLMGLRLREGIDLDAYRARWGTAPHAEKIAALAADGFLVQTGSQLAATPKGVLVLNRLIAELA